MAHKVQMTSCPVERGFSRNSGQVAVEQNVAEWFSLMSASRGWGGGSASGRKKYKKIMVEIVDITALQTYINRCFNA